MDRASPLLTAVALALPFPVQAASHVAQLINNLLLPPTVDAAVYNDLQRVLRVFDPFRPWTVGAMDGAAARGNLELLDWLHDNRTEGCSSQAFNLAAANNHVDVLLWLYEKYSHQCNPAEMLAAVAGVGNIGIFKSLRSRYFREDPEATLEVAAANGQLEMVEHLVRTEGGLLGMRALTAAAKNGHTGIVQTLLEHSTTDFEICRPALLTAAVAGHVDVVVLLLDHVGNDTRFANAALEKAAEAGQMNSILALLPRCDAHGISQALAAAVPRSSTETVKFLIRECAPSEMAFAVKAAADSDQSALLEVLLAKCAADEAVSWPGRDPIRQSFISAAKRGRCSIVKLLAGRCVKRLTSAAFYALDQAVTHHHTEAVGIILDVSNARGLVVTSDHLIEKVLADNDIEMLELLVKNLTKSRAGCFLTKATTNEAVKVLAEKSAQKSIGLAVADAALHHHTEKLSILYEYANDAAIRQAVIEVASAGKFLTAIALMRWCDSATSLLIFRDAAGIGITGLVELTMDFGGWSSTGIVRAARNGHIDIVKMLLGKSDSSTRALALKKAVKGDHQHIVELVRDWRPTPKVTVKRESDAGAASLPDTKRARLE